jgi:hypothetical protein
LIASLSAVGRARRTADLATGDERELVGDERLQRVVDRDVELAVLELNRERSVLDDLVARDLLQQLGPGVRPS